MTRLTESPQLQQQIDDFTCGHACIAMALGCSIENVIAEADLAGFDRQRGMSERQLSYLLMQHGICCYQILNVHGVAFSSGHYIGTTYSLNGAAGAHYVYFLVSDGQAYAYDPQTGRKGKKSFKSWDELELLSVTRLDDFRDILKKDPERGSVCN